MAVPFDNEVLIVRYGTREARRSEVFLNYWMTGEADGPIDMDYFFWLIRTPSGTLLVDCGFSAAAGAARGRRLLVDPVEAASALGAGPGDAPDIIVTHEHYDHIGNLASWDASRIHLARAEYEFWRSPMARRALFASVSDDGELAAVERARSEGRVFLFDEEFEPAPGVLVIPVGGHTAGQAMVLVQTAGGAILLTSDVVHYQEELDRDMPFVHVDSLPRMYAGLDRVRELAAREGALLVPGHDPAAFAAPSAQIVDGLPAHARRLVPLNARDGAA